MAHAPHPPPGKNESWDDLIQKCWPRQECWDCLRQDPCSWCPSVICTTLIRAHYTLIQQQSGTCVPNTYDLQILAPIFNPDVCALWSERWELRARLLGCHVSTITLLTCVITVLSTFVVIGLVAAGIKAVRWMTPRWKARRDGWWKVWRYYQPGWWRGWKVELVDNRRRTPLESAPLLP